MITRIYEFGCDNCGQAEHPAVTSIGAGKKYLVARGWVFTRVGKAYCRWRCYKGVV